MSVPEVQQHLTIHVAAEDVAVRLALGAQLRIVVDLPVVDEREATVRTTERLASRIAQVLDSEPGVKKLRGAVWKLDDSVTSRIGTPVVKARVRSIRSQRGGSDAQNSRETTHASASSSVVECPR